jgi:hypothetical protein
VRRSAWDPLDLGDYAVMGGSLHIVCGRAACGHAVRFTMTEAVQRFGQVTLEALEGRLRCTSCGQRKPRAFHQARPDACADCPRWRDHHDDRRAATALVNAAESTRAAPSAAPRPPEAGPRPGG